MARQTVIAIVGAALLGAALVGGGLAAGTMIASDPVDSAAAQPTETSSGRTIAVSATGQAEAQPDKALIRLSVEATADDPNTARKQVAENVSAIRSALVDLGLNESQVRTVDFNIYSDEERHRKGEETETVYRARHAILIELNDIELTGQAIDAAVAAGATDVDDVSYTLSRSTRQEIRQEALRDAMGSARTQAGTLAEAAGLTIVDVHAINTVETHDPVHRFETALAAAGDAGTDLNAGPVTVTVSVSVQYNATTTG